MIVFAIRRASVTKDGKPMSQPHATTELSDVRELLFEADCLEEEDGPNAYSAYLRKHRRRPSRKEADDIGRAMSARVRADDGTMRPLPTAAQRKARKTVVGHFENDPLPGKLPKRNFM